MSGLKKIFSLLVLLSITAALFCAPVKAEGNANVIGFEADKNTGEEIFFYTANNHYYIGVKVDKPVTSKPNGVANVQVNSNRISNEISASVRNYMLINGRTVGYWMESTESEYVVTIDYPGTVAGTGPQPEPDRYVIYIKFTKVNLIKDLSPAKDVTIEIKNGFKLEDGTLLNPCKYYYSPVTKKFSATPYSPDGGNQGGTASGSQGGATGGNQGGTTGGNQGGTTGGNQGGTTTGTQSGATGGNQGGTAGGTWIEGTQGEEIDFVTTNSSNVKFNTDNEKLYITKGYMIADVYDHITLHEKVGLSFFDEDDQEITDDRTEIASGMIAKLVLLSSRDALEEFQVVLNTVLEDDDTVPGNNDVDAQDNGWLLYLLIGLGAVVIIGGAAAFVIFKNKKQRRV